MIKALSTDPKMTVKEVSEILKCDPDTVRRHVKKEWPELLKNGKTTYLTETQVTFVKLQIERSGRNDLRNVAELPQTDLEKKMIVQQAMMILNDEISQLKSDNEQLQIELDESKKWHSVKRVKMLGHIPEVSARKAWNPLKKWSIENGYRIISIFDANYGDVKTYHADAWKAVYGVEL